MKKIISAVCCAAAISICFISCRKTPLPAKTEFRMGTVCTVNLYERGTDALYERMFSRLNEIEAVFSVNLPDSVVSNINRAAGLEPVPVSDEVLYVLEKALAIAEATGGMFDPSIGPLVSLWGIGSDSAHVPQPEEIAAAKKLVDYRLVRLDKTERTVFLAERGMQLDLGGIVKGYAADELASIAAENGVKRALFDLGGNVYAYGRKPDGTAWRVGVKNPLAPEGQPLIKLELENKSVVTSGVYERFFFQDGVRYHHILDIKSGYPMRNEVLSATVVSESSMLADALSTSVFLLGPESGLALLAAQGADGIIVTEDRAVYATPQIRRVTTIMNPEFSLKTE
ncbi:FAD:protein FMN transferase [Treponema brennaborense]|uniref:FAD:protein FMN transferase n=1 Tax=Treponema brennaborense (strain DSM 12168 / CIP 105900 / DD5/3) TaxID=906968 RepID=F4LME4_TREBD|nr:FAD:protein FMN transferase [Treponema brennaborense]AEE15706.1 ApbE family lipoprotein [Treponema brennaborense DSM 12168]